MHYNKAISVLQNFTNRRIKQTEVADVLGVTKQAITNRINRGLEFSEFELELLSKHFQVDLVNKDVRVSNDILLDYYPEVYASCGNGAEPFSTRSEKMSVSKNIIKGFDKHKRYNVINTTSDSMMPEIYPNDFLVIETDPESIKDNSIYVFTYDNEIYCKYLCRNITEIIVRSANKTYRDIFIIGDDRQKIKVLGEVVAVMRDLTR